MVGINCTGQDDIHFTQYKWIPVFQNPGLAGQIEDGNMAYGILYRDQAFTVTPNQYNSLAAYIDSRFILKGTNSLGLSLMFVDDKAGDGQLHTNELALNAAYEFSLSKRHQHFLSFGIQGLFIQRRYGDLSAFVFEEELMGGTLTESLINNSYGYPDISLGLSYRNTIDAKSNLKTGISVNHFNNGLAVNKEEIIDKYDMKYSLFVEYKRKMSNSIWLEPKIQFQKSSVFKSTQVQTVLHFLPSKKSPYIFKMGVGWRVEDALELLLGVQYKSWEIGLAYDTNTSGLRTASGEVVGLELGIKYKHFRPEKKEEIPEETIPVVTPIQPVPVDILIQLPPDIPEKDIHIIVIEDSIPLIDKVHENWPYEQDIDADKPYEFIIKVPDYKPDTISLIPGEYDPFVTQEIILTLVPNFIEDDTPVVVETPEEVVEEVPENPGERIVHIGEPIVLERIYYDFDKDNILPESEIELTKIYDLMIKYDDMVIELSSHTDVRGDDDYNVDLSQRRAASARRWLIQIGIAEDRIIAKGYGEKRLYNHCDNGVICSEVNHRKNRRTEFTIIAGPSAILYMTTEKK